MAVKEKIGMMQRGIVGGERGVGGQRGVGGGGGEGV